MEPTMHFVNNVKVLSQFNEWPKNQMERNIFFKEVFRMPDFMKELKNKYHSTSHLSLLIGLSLGRWP